MLDIIYSKTGLLIPPDLIPELKVEKRTYKKSDFVIKEGQVEKYVYALRKGAVKVIYTHKDTTFILGFWFKGDMFSSLVSFLEQSPSKTSIVAITETEVERVDYSQIQKYYKQYHMVSEVGRKIIEHQFILKANRELNMLSKTAEERYIELIQQSGHLILDQPVKEIASYLGIHPESLSRIRRRIKQQLLVKK
ncbi:MAG TPA: Crp/Fnr family transcriptional regulator [Bacteroidia bacterium]|jgi:CRP-like cAMP-binding protein|nr:Crp/Fnr family transcriptional regulator [Bacteroidia bacterium]